MKKTPVSKFLKAIHAAHGAKARLLSRESVREHFEGEVLVFEIEGHPTTHLCYAWEVDGQVTSVLHEGAVDSPEKAVQTAIMAEGPEPAEAG